MALPKALLDRFRPDAAVWRRALMAGVSRGPESFLRYSPPLIGVAFGAALPEMRSKVLQNLRLIQGRRSRAEELYAQAAVFSNYASCLTEALLLSCDRGYRLRSSAQGLEHYRSAAASGRGVIIATAHTAGWEIIGPVLSGVHPADVVVVMQRERDPAARAIQDGARERAGVRVVHVGESALDALPLIAHLRRGSVVAMQIDRLPPGLRGIPVEFFGAPWQVPEGTLKLAAVSGAPILPVFARRRAFMDYEAVVAPAIHLSRRPTPAETENAAQRLIGSMERFVRENPTQWFHFA